MIYIVARQGIGEEWKRSRLAAGPQGEDDVKKARVLSHRMHVKGLHPVVGKDRVLEVGPLVDRQSPDLLGIKNHIIKDGFPADNIEWEPCLPVAGGVGNVSSTFDVIFDPMLPEGQVRVRMSVDVRPAVDAIKKLGGAAEVAATAMGKAVREGSFTLQSVDPKWEAQVFDFLTESMDRGILTRAEVVDAVYKSGWGPKTKLDAVTLFRKTLTFPKPDRMGVIKPES